MIRPNWWILLISTIAVLWQESAENPALFCYRIGWGTLLNLRSRALAPIPISTRNEAACWNPSVTSFTHSTTRKGSGS
jgi:hypothetical protein